MLFLNKFLCRNEYLQPIWRVIKKRRVGKAMKYLESDKEIIKSLKDKYEGGRCFLIGNGPSLNKMDLTLLKNEITFGVNAIYLNYPKMGFLPTFYSVEDFFVAEDRATEINRLTGVIKLIPIDLAYCFKKTNGLIYINFIRSHDFFPSFSYDCSDKIFWGSTVTYMNMQFAYYLGFVEVYLIGMDFNYKVPKNIEGCEIISEKDDINHFHPDYFGKGYRWHHPRLDRVAKAFEHARYEFEKNNRKIINASTGGKLEIFERCDFKDLF